MQLTTSENRTQRQSPFGYNSVSSDRFKKGNYNTASERPRAVRGNRTHATPIVVPHLKELDTQGGACLRCFARELWRITPGVRIKPKYKTREIYITCHQSQPIPSCKLQAPTQTGLTHGIYTMHRERFSAASGPGSDMCPIPTKHI